MARRDALGRNVSDDHHGRTAQRRDHSNFAVNLIHATCLWPTDSRLFGRRRMAAQDARGGFAVDIEANVSDSCPGLATKSRANKIGLKPILA